MYHLFELRPYKTGELNCYPNITKEQFYSWVADLNIDWRGVVGNIIEIQDDIETMLSDIEFIELKDLEFRDRSLYPYDEAVTFSLYKHSEKRLIELTSIDCDDWEFFEREFPDFIDWLKNQMKLYVQDLDNQLEFTL